MCNLLTTNTRQAITRQVVNPTITPKPVEPKPSPTPRTQTTDSENKSDHSVGRKYNSYSFDKSVTFSDSTNGTVRENTSGTVHSNLAYYVGRVNSHQSIHEQRESSRAMFKELIKVGDLSKIDKSLLEKIKSIAGVENDSELQVISEIMSDPNYQTYFSDTLSAFELSKILKALPKDGSIKEDFLKSFVSTLKNFSTNPESSIKTIKDLVNSACMSNNVVFNENLMSLQDRCNPFLTEQEISDKKADGNKPVSLAELSASGKLNSSKYNGIAVFLGVGKNTQASFELLAKVTVPKWLADMIVQSNTKDLPMLLEQYKQFIQLPDKSGKKDETQTTTPPAEENSDKPNGNVLTEPQVNTNETKPLNEISTKVKEIISKIKSSGANRENINELIEFLKNSDFSQLNSDVINDLESTIGVKTLSDLNLLGNLLNSSKYSSSFEKNLSIPNLIKIMVNLKDSSDKKLFLNTMMTFLDSKNGINLSGINELVKTTCRDKNIVFNTELHNKADRCNPLLTSQEVQDKKSKENEMVSLADVEKSLKITTVKRDQVLFGLIKGKSERTESTENEQLKVEMPRWLSDLMSSAQSVDELKKIIDENKDFIKYTYTSSNPEEVKGNESQT